MLGPAVASYTSVLLADTAVPAWHEGHRELPFVFAGSAVTAAGGLGMLAVRPDDAGQAVRFAVLEAASAPVCRARPEAAVTQVPTGKVNDHQVRLNGSRWRAARMVRAVARLAHNTAKPHTGRP